MGQSIHELLPVAELPAGSRVLDLGCGAGTVPYARFPHVEFFGVDQYANENIRNWPSNARLLLGEAEHLPWRDACFDLAICNFVFEHFSEPRRALRELARVIRPRGYLYLSVPRGTSAQDRLYRYVLKGGGHLQHYSFQSFLQMVYEETAFKLEVMGPAPAGFTWLREIPYGGLIRSLLYRGFHWWRRATGTDALASSDFLLLFQLGERPGLKVFGGVCSNCGHPAQQPVPDSETTWRCPDCAFENIRI